MTPSAAEGCFWLTWGLGGALLLPRASAQATTANGEYIESVRDDWTSRADLELAPGGPLRQTRGSRARTGGAG